MGAAEDKCRKAIRLLGFSHPHFLVAHAYITYAEQATMSTMGICDDGVIRINPEFVDKLDKHELGGIIAHEECHLLLRHHERRGNRDPMLFNIAGDMVINHALKRDNITLPNSVLLPPQEYITQFGESALVVEAVYDWLQKNPQHIPDIGQGCSGCGAGKPGKNQGQGQGKGRGKCTCGGQGKDPLPGRGCGVTETGSQKREQDKEKTKWDKVAAQARAMSQLAGTGSDGFSNMLSPVNPKIDWKRIIKYGFEMAWSIIGKDDQTYNKRNRRTASDGVIYPGWISMNPVIAFIVDVSGSMDQKWLSSMAGEIKKCMQTFPGSKVYMVVHTSQVEWKGWLTPSTNFNEAFGRTGGTDPIDAYIEVNKASRFSTVVHFTDTFFSEPWPEVKCKQFIIGKYGDSPGGCTPPAGAKVIPTDVSIKE